jgi:hypothetical protein
MLVHPDGLGGAALRESPAVLSMWLYTVKLNEEKSKYAGLAQEIVFGSV